MRDDELKALQKTMRKAKRIASEKAGALHDLVEDGLPGAYRDLPALAQETYDACKAWDEARATLDAAEKG
ncbi:CCE_0567 family metalloprotein [Varunaivibrio sulfuroxidans]|uniref:Rop-like protein n=1 Tax=Varunaivibrio sulfuroxidans TaxID=1773489 RepID=A0A4R3J8G0_9PROT|nr:CCE_0567 family metalloprotein [Varunaivibrio sulfuroxidans]TCS61754.1 Rop-like protein [Varunaivibrio sulfuroxidans]WES32062.1 CCE_0567 family metalloprotein [Varunaivibrio sulfuroxidans]